MHISTHHRAVVAFAMGASVLLLAPLAQAAPQACTGHIVASPNKTGDKRPAWQCKTMKTDSYICSLNPKSNKPCCLAGSEPYGSDEAGWFCCGGKLNASRSSCEGDVCALTADKMQGNRACYDQARNPMWCPGSTKLYGTASAGYFCCNGDTNGSTCKGDICALSHNKTQGYPVCQDAATALCNDSILGVGRDVLDDRNHERAGFYYGGYAGGYCSYELDPSLDSSHYRTCAVGGSSLHGCAGGESGGVGTRAIATVCAVAGRAKYCQNGLSDLSWTNFHPHVAARATGVQLRVDKTRKQRGANRSVYLLVYDSHGHKSDSQFLALSDGDTTFANHKLKTSVMKLNSALRHDMHSWQISTKSGRVCLYTDTNYKGFETCQFWTQSGTFNLAGDFNDKIRSARVHNGVGFKTVTLFKDYDAKGTSMWLPTYLPHIAKSAAISSFTIK